MTQRDPLRLLQLIMMMPKMISIISSFSWNPKNRRHVTRTSQIITHDTLRWTHRHGYLTLAVCVRVVRGSKRDTKRDRGGNREKKGSGERERIMLGVCHLHTLDIHIRDERTRCVLKVKYKMNAFVAAPIVRGQSCVILLLSVQTGEKKKNQRQPLRES